MRKSSSLFIRTIDYLGVAQLVERLAWDEEDFAGAEPATQTTWERMVTDYLVHWVGSTYSKLFFTSKTMYKLSGSIPEVLTKSHWPK